LKKFYQSFARKYIKEAYDNLNEKKVSLANSENNQTMLQQFLVHQKSSKLSFEEIVAISK
jgi:hypothetical protein